MSAKPNLPPTRSDEDFRWTPRQREVLDLIARGYTNSQIADDMGISLDGAKYHVSEILSKLGTNSRDEAAIYWRRQHGLPGRIARLVNSLAIGIPLKWGIGTAAGAVALVGAAGAVVMVNADDDGNTPASQETATPAETPEDGDATPTPEDDETPEPTSTPPDTAMGEDVREFEMADPVGIPGEGMLILTERCSGCDTPARTPMRAYVDPVSGQRQLETIEPPGDGTVAQVFASRSTPGPIHIVTCNNSCPGAGFIPPDSESTVWRSIDGGTTWNEVVTATGYLHLFQLNDDALLAHRSWSEDDGREGQIWEIGEEEIAQTEFAPGDVPGPNSQSIAYIDGEALEVIHQDGAIVGRDGSIAWQPELDPAPANNPYVAIDTWRTSERRVVQWSTQGHDLTAVYEGDDLAYVYDGRLDVARWFEDWTAIGQLPRDQLEGNSDAGTGHVLAVVDFASGDTALIAPDLFPPDPGSKHVGEAYLPGPLARVSGAGTCLNVREEPASDGEVIECYVDGVLLRDLDDTESGDGFEWLQVETPTGETGWAATDFLER